MRIKIKKFLVLSLLALLSLAVVSCGKATTTVEKTTKKEDVFEGDGSCVYLHYYRFQGDYTNWDVWSWGDGQEGHAFKFTEDSGELSYGGMVAKINTTVDMKRVGFIVRRGDWAEKDIASDRYIELPADFSVDNPVHIYVLEGCEEFGYSLETAPTKTKKFKNAYWSGENTIYIIATNPINANTLKLFTGDTELEITGRSINGIKGTITLKEKVDFNKDYTLKGTFDEEVSIEVSFDGAYETEGFGQAFNYDGELGAIIKDNKTTFRVWAPTSKALKLNLYDNGTTLEDSTTAHPGTNTPIATYDMVKGEKGTWEYVANSNLHGTYYTFTVTNSSGTHEVVDPYAKSCGLNGQRGLVVDFSQVNPTSWEYGNTGNTGLANVDQIIYEAHVRDFSISSTWNGTKKRGTFLAMAESGTTYEGVKTGFDHLADLGITSLQILPFYDWPAGVDEKDVDDPTKDVYNWGYMPLNYNCLEGSYSTNPWDGLVRIREFKELVLAYTSVGININMDVVFNHTGLTADSNFSYLVPGYYYRFTTDGAYSNGSGCGNETASERYMMRKFMIDSTEFWVNEYNIAGFRFDLMALHDIDTMNAIASNLKEINPSIMIYGEPWTGGTTTLPAEKQAVKTNMNEMPSVGAFNDNFRDGVKGSVFSSGNQGFLQGDNGKIEQVRDGIRGRFINAFRIVGNPSQVINYTTCHDNNTLHDKLKLSVKDITDAELLEMQKQAYSLILLAEGIPFIHAGDEFLRSKVMADGSYDHNSYDSGDKVNEMDWSLLKKNAAMNEHLKALIALRKAHTSFRLRTNEDVDASITFLDSGLTGVIMYQITNVKSADTASTILVIHANNAQTITLPSGNWTYLFGGTGSASGSLSIKKNESVVLSK